MNAIPPLGPSPFVDIEPGLYEQFRQFVTRHPERLEHCGTRELRYWLRASDGSALDLAAYSESAKYVGLTPHWHDGATGEGLVLLICSWEEPPSRTFRGCSYGGSCMSKAKVTATIKLILKTALQPPLLAAPGDPVHSSQLDARRVSAVLRTKNPQRVDRGKSPMEESPLFGGPAQGSLF